MPHPELGLGELSTLNGYIIRYVTDMLNQYERTQSANVTALYCCMTVLKVTMHRCISVQIVHVGDRQRGTIVPQSLLWRVCESASEARA